MGPKRDWRDAREKVDAEAGTTGCRMCGEARGLQAAHVAPRRVDKPKGGSTVLYVEPDRILPLCPGCHGKMDAGRLDTLGALTLAEQVQAVIDLGGIEAARMRLVPSEYSKLPDRRADQVERLVEAVRDLPGNPLGVRLSDQRRAEIAAALEPFGDSTYRPPHFAPQENAA